MPEGVESFPASPSTEEHVWSETREKAELEVGEKVASVAAVATKGYISQAFFSLVLSVDFIFLN